MDEKIPGMRFMAKTEEKKENNAEASEKRSNGEEMLSLEMLKSLKKPIFGLSILIGIIGIFVTLVIAFVANGVIEEGEKVVVLQLNAALGTIDSIENTFASISDASEGINTTVSDTKAAMASLKEGIGTTGSSLKSFGGVLKTISLGVVGLSSYGTQISDAGDALTEAATEMETVEADLEETKKSAEDIKLQINDIKNSIKEQGNVLGKSKSDIISIFEGLKMANILFAIMLLMMFSVLILNAIGGIL